MANHWPELSRLPWTIVLGGLDEKVKFFSFDD